MSVVIISMSLRHISKGTVSNCMNLHVMIHKLHTFIADLIVLLCVYYTAVYMAVGEYIVKVISLL
jgi:hypothetical protein